MLETTAATTHGPTTDAVQALAAWRDGDPAGFPFASVLDALRRPGKHHAPASLLAALAQARETLVDDGSPAAQRLARFLATALDKHDGRFDNPSYLGLAMLPLPRAGGCPHRAAAQRDRLLVLLAADIVGFELDALDGRSRYLTEMPADARIVAKRCRHALRAATPALERLGLAVDAPHGDAIAQGRALRETVERAADADERLMLELTMLPVHLIHDEHLFVRVLQAYETVFSLVAAQLAAATSLLAAGRVGDAARLVDAAAEGLGEGSPLFSLLGTMRPEAFLAFREYTDGASAIQSRSYKTIESLCRRPDADRLDSPAYHEVPDVRARVLAGQSNLDEALADAVQAGTLCPAAHDAICAAMKRFEGALGKWRKTHHSLAERMLGFRRGTGHTAGVPYLAKARAVAVFATACPRGTCPHRAALATAA